MAGTLTISTLSDGTNSTSATNCIQGSAKAWVNFNGSGTVAIRASYNVSSITDNGIGDYTINFTNAMPDANYCATGMTFNGDTNGNRGAGGVQIFDTTTTTASALRIFTAYGATASSDGAKNDQAIICVSVFR